MTQNPVPESERVEFHAWISVEFHRKLPTPVTTTERTPAGLAVSTKTHDSMTAWTGSLLIPSDGRLTRSDAMDFMLKEIVSAEVLARGFTKDHIRVIGFDCGRNEL